MKTVMTVDDSASSKADGEFCACGTAAMRLSRPWTDLDALSKLKGQEVHLILSDINMPQMSGIELTRQLRALPQYKFVPIILLTTESHPEKKLEGKAAGATGWIVKPFTPEQILAVLKKVMR